MAGFERKRFMAKLTHSRASYVILGLLAILFVYNAVGAYNKSRLAEEKMNTAGKELSQLEEQKAKLSIDLENANSDFGREKALREKFNVVKAGEKVIVIVDDKSPTTTPAAAAKSGFWVRIFGK